MRQCEELEKQRDKGRKYWPQSPDAPHRPEPEADAATARDATECKEKCPDISLLSPQTQGLGHAAIDKPTQRPHEQESRGGWEGVESTGVNLKCRAEQQKGKNRVSE